MNNKIFDKGKRLYRILFLVSVGLLLWNDLYLKYEYHNSITGKLSDFAGLFAFPYFFSCFYKKRIKSIYIGTGILFLIWKSEFSQPIFDFAHAHSIGIDRTVDYWDLIALLILPISFLYWKKETKAFIKPKRIFKPILIAICCFSFIATTLPSKDGSYNFKSDYETIVKMNKDSVINKGYLYQSNRKHGYLYSIEFPEKSMSIETKVNLEKVKGGQIKIMLDSILNYSIRAKGTLWFHSFNKDDVKYLEGLSKSDIEKLFAEQLKNNLNKGN